MPLAMNARHGQQDWQMVSQLRKLLWTLTFVIPVCKLS